MYPTMTTNGYLVQQRKIQWLKALTTTAVFVLAMALLADSAFAGAGAAQARINTVATGWQGIVMGVGVAVLSIAWAVIGYQIAFNGKQAKDMYPTMLGSTIAGMAPILVGWLFTP